MTANEILKNYLEALQATDGGDEIRLKDVILDILKYLDYREKGKDRGDESYPMIPQYKNDLLWVEIGNKSLGELTQIPYIELPELRRILEKYKILGDEKDGM